MNLRLRPDAEQALRAEADRSRRSQQDVLRAAVDRYLGLDDGGSGSGEPRDELLASGRVRPPRSAYRKILPGVDATSAVPSLSLLGRDDRF